MPVYERVAMSLHKLGSDDRLQNMKDLYKVHKSTLSKIGRECCKVVRKHLQLVSVYIPSDLWFKF